MNHGSEMFSRGGTSNPFGKCTEQLKTDVPEYIKERFCGLAALHGMNSSEYLRMLVMTHTEGHAEVLRLMHRPAVFPVRESGP